MNRMVSIQWSSRDDPPNRVIRATTSRRGGTAIDLGLDWGQPMCGRMGDAGKQSSRVEPSTRVATDYVWSRQNGQWPYRFSNQCTRSERVMYIT